MVGRVLKPAACALCLALAAQAAAETVVSTELTFLGMAERTESGDTAAYNLTDAEFSLDSRGSQEVKGELTVGLILTDTFAIDLKRAYLKARLDSVRLTAGKTRLSWGEGAMFNSGDVIFGSGDVDLTAEDLRDDTKWLASIYVPLGDFSFVELVALPPDLPVSEYLRYAANQDNPLYPKPEMPSYELSSAGGRLYATVAGVKAETGCLYDGMAEEWRPYLSLQGNFLADLHVSGSYRMPRDEPFGKVTRESLEMSGGLFYEIPVTTDTGSEETPSSFNVNVRLEGLVKPYGTWEEEDLPLPGFSPLGTGVPDSPYAVALYPEISVKSDTVFAYARSLVSPVDRSALLGTGVHWSPLEGFTLLAAFDFQAGAYGDAYGWKRARGWQCSLGSRVRF